jgi:hypothetical protein
MEYRYEDTFEDYTVVIALCFISLFFIVIQWISYLHIPESQQFPGNLMIWRTVSLAIFFVQQLITIYLLQSKG